MRFPRLFRVRSTLSLILTGFALMLIPLIVAFGVLTYYMNHVAAESQRLVRDAIATTQGARELINQLVAMERSALQYMVVEDEDHLTRYWKAHDAFKRTIGELSQMPLNTPLHAELVKLNVAERELFEEFGDPRTSPARGEKPVVWFLRAQEQAQNFLRQCNEWVEQELQRLQTLTDSTNRNLSLIVIALGPVLALLAGLFTMLIVRPLRSVSKAIYQLGSEDFDTALVVRGPRDVEELGKRLNWLRLQLGEIEQQKARFLRHMSHELKTPLTGLREAAELLSEEVIGPLNEDQRQVVSIMRENTLLFQELIINLVNFNQALLRNQVMNYERVRLDELVQRVVTTQHMAWKAKQIEVELDLEPVEITVDRSKLMTVVDNLLSNAIKFSPRDDTVSIAVQRLGQNAVRIDVRDHGPGFHPDDQALVFEAFYQGKFMPDSHVQGSGLGLAIVREYVEAHGGQINIVDDARGGHLRVVLPLQREAAA